MSAAATPFTRMLPAVRMVPAVRTVLATLVGLVVLTGCGVPTGSSTSPAPSHRPSRHPTTTSKSSAPAAPAAPAAPGSATAALAGLVTKGRAPMTGYARERFGQAWLDADRNGCDTRNDVLGRDLTDVVDKPGTAGCLVLSGRLADPYTATTIGFVYGDGTLVDVDHVVALGDVWATGGDRWSIEERAAIANDPENLLAVDASANRQKGDGDAATWLPPNRSFRCAYVARQVSVKAKYGLSVTSAEREAMTRVLARCPDQRVVADSGAPTAVDQHLTDPGAPSTSAPGAPGGDGLYATCDEARAAGAAPLRRGQPGYSPSLDGDDDGIACE